MRQMLDFGSYLRRHEHLQAYITLWFPPGTAPRSAPVGMDGLLSVKIVDHVLTGLEAGFQVLTSRDGFLFFHRFPAPERGTF